MVYDLSAPKIAIVLGNSSVEEQLCSLLSSAHVTILFDLTTPHWPSYLPRTLIAAAHTHALVLTTSIDDDDPLVATVRCTRECYRCTSRSIVGADDVRAPSNTHQMCT